MLQSGRTTRARQVAPGYSSANIGLRKPSGPNIGPIRFTGTVPEQRPIRGFASSRENRLRPIRLQKVAEEAERF